MKKKEIEDLILYYKVKMEDQTNIPLEFSIDSFYNYGKNMHYINLEALAMKIDQKKISEMAKNFEFHAKKLVAEALFPLTYVSGFLLGLAKKGMLQENKITEEKTLYYSPFYKKDIDRTIIHELTHELWYGLEKFEDRYSFDNKPNQLNWMEAFAYYGENIYFNFLKPIYKEDVTWEQYVPLEYRDTYDKVNEIVKHSQSNFFKIPLMWEEYEKKFSSLSK